MIKRTGSPTRSASERTASAGKAWRRQLAIALLTLGLAPIACLSDITVRDCVEHGKCDTSGAAGKSGGASSSGSGSVAEAGGAGDPPWEGKQVLR